MSDIRACLEQHLNADDGTHSFRSPSSAERWLRCPRAPYLEALVKDEPSPKALQGTLAHGVAYVMFLRPDQSDFKELLGFEWRGQVVDQEMLDHCLRYRDEASALADTGAFFVEQRVNIGEGVFGTLDFGGLKDGILHIRDFKYGEVYVDPENNPQLKLYALGFLRRNGLAHVHDVVLSIDQPRAYGETVKEWHTTPEALQWWFDFEVCPLPSEDLPRDLWPEAVPGGIQCANCKAAKAGICEAVEKQSQCLSELVKVEKPSQPLISKPVEEMTADELGVLLSFEAGYKAWQKGVDAQLKKAKDQAVAFLERGEAVPGHKLVNGKSSRDWKSEAEFIELCKRLGCSPYAEAKVMSPAQAEKVIDFKILAPLIEVTIPRTVAPMDSKSKEIIVL